MHTNVTCDFKQFNATANLISADCDWIFGVFGITVHSRGRDFFHCCRGVLPRSKHDQFNCEKNHTSRAY